MMHLGIKIDDADTEKMHKTWRAFVNDAQGEERASSPDFNTSVTRNPGSEPQTPAASSPRARHDVRKVNNVMKTILYNWQHGAVRMLERWLAEKHISTITPKEE